VINCPDVMRLQGSSFKPAVNIPLLPDTGGAGRRPGNGSQTYNYGSRI
jgi:hypothetical protein